MLLSENEWYVFFLALDIKNQIMINMINNWIQQRRSSFLKIIFFLLNMLEFFSFRTEENRQNTQI